MAGKRATTDNAKEEIMEDLLSIWKEHPDMRFAQLIGNVYHIPSGADPYHVEDYDFVNAISKFYAPEDD